MPGVSVTYLPIFTDNPDNPARCEVKTGRIEINRLIYDLLPDYQKEYVLQHEKGHYYRQTYNEVEADAYALEQLKLRKPNSLWHYVLSVRAISHDDPVRCRAAEKAALQVAAQKGSKEAKRLLPYYEQSRYANAAGTDYNPNATAAAFPVEINIPPLYLMLITTIIVFIAIAICTLRKE